MNLLTSVAEYNDMENPLRHTARLLIQLHRLIRAGEGESSEAEAIRDELDIPWREFDARTMRLVRGLSADLRSIERPRGVSESADPLSAAEFVASAARNDWRLSLEVLRNNEPSLPTRLVAFCRGLCWSHLGQPEAAIEFFREADRIEPLRDGERAWLLLAYLLADEMEVALAGASAAATSSSSSTLLFIAAEIFSLQADSDGLSAAEATRRLAIEVGQRALIASQDNGDTLPDFLRPAALMQLSLNYDAIGNREAARDACERALEIAPTDEYALLLLGWLSSEKAPKDGRPAFRRSVSRAIAKRSLPSVSAAA